MAIKELTSVVTAPPHPRELGDAKKWENVQDELGMKLPKDIFDFAMRYGTGEFSGPGTFSGSLEVFNPFSLVYSTQLETAIERFELEPARGVQLPHKLHPTRPGLFPWGGDSNITDYLWLTKGPPEDWPIITWTEKDEFAQWDMPMTTFLAKLFRNQIPGISIHGQRPTGPVVFVPKSY